MNTQLTENQKKVLRALIDAGSVDGVPLSQKLDLDQLIESLPYEVTKQALQFTLRSLAKRGYIEKSGTDLRRGKRRVIWQVTSAGVRLLPKIA